MKKMVFNMMDKIFKVSVFICFSIIIPFVVGAQAPATQTFTSSGSWVISAGSGYHANITVYVWGGGGGGGNATNESAGGGGGGYSTRSFTNVGAGSYAVVVGSGGTAGNAGGPSSFAGPGAVTLTANGGGSSSAPLTGGAGGTASGGSTNRTGGAGGTAPDGGGADGGGGGGGSGPSSASGSNGTTSTTAGANGGAGGSTNIGVTGTGSGNGGLGAAADGSPDAAAGTSPGGGGGGKGDAGTSKSGAQGLVIVVVTQALPIQLATFEVINAKHPIINWSTFSELNNNHFYLERSEDGSSFDKLAIISGKGTSDRENFYTYTDMLPFKGKNYYRLSQTDDNGITMTYPAKSVLVSLEDIAVFPTIFDQDVTLQMPPPYDKSVTWVLYDAFGRTILTGNSPGQPVQQIQLSRVQSGNYVFAVLLPGGQKSQRLVKL